MHAKSMLCFTHPMQIFGCFPFLSPVIPKQSDYHELQTLAPSERLLLYPALLLIFKTHVENQKKKKDMATKHLPFNLSETNCHARTMNLAKFINLRVELFYIPAAFSRGISTTQPNSPIRATPSFSASRVAVTVKVERCRLSLTTVLLNRSCRARDSLVLLFFSYIFLFPSDGRQLFSI